MQRWWIAYLGWLWWSFYNVCLLFSLSNVPLLWDPVDYRSPGPSVHRILQVRILQWVAISFSRGSPLPRDQTHIFCMAGGFCTTEGLPWWLSREESTCQFRRHGFDPWVSKILWRRKWQLLQCPCLGNPMERAVCWAKLNGVLKSWTGFSD